MNNSLVIFFLSHFFKIGLKARDPHSKALITNNVIGGADIKREHKRIGEDIFNLNICFKMLLRCKLLMQNNY